MAELDNFIDAMPKAELHVHIEGTLEPELMFELAARNGIALPYASVDAARAAYEFADLQGFLELFYGGAAVLRTDADFYDLTRAYLARARADNVIHAEIFFDPQTHTARGVGFDTAVRGIGRALDEATAGDGPTSRLIMCFLRDRPVAAAEATLDAALDHRGHITGVGLDSAERDYPPEMFADVYARARAAGFRAVAHAGEEGPPDYVRGAVETLLVERIDHGIAAIDDVDLTAELSLERIPFTVCPLSNVKLGAVASMAAHPLRRMLEAGLMVTINSDDPAYFGGYINANFRAAAAALDLGRAELTMMVRNAFDAAFIDDDARAALHARLDAYLE